MSNAMSEGIGQDAFIDEGELEDELANLEMEVTKERTNHETSHSIVFAFKRDWMNK